MIHKINNEIDAYHFYLSLNSHLGVFMETPTLFYLKQCYEVGHYFTNFRFLGGGIDTHIYTHSHARTFPFRLSALPSAAPLRSSTLSGGPRSSGSHRMSRKVEDEHTEWSRAPCLCLCGERKHSVSAT